MSPQLFDFLIFPGLIFLARIADVSMDTIRVILVSKGYKKHAPLFGFLQSLIWVITISRIIVNLDNWLAYIAYAGGFAMGTIVGMRIEEKIALGHELIRIITKKNAYELINKLRENGFAVTSAVGQGKDGEVGILYVIIKRRAMKKVVDIINTSNPKAFYTIEDMRYVAEYVK